MCAAAMVAVAVLAGRRLCGTRISVDPLSCPPAGPYVQRPRISSSGQHSISGGANGWVVRSGRTAALPYADGLAARLPAGVSLQCEA